MIKLEKAEQSISDVNSLELTRVCVCLIPHTKIFSLSTSLSLSFSLSQPVIQATCLNSCHLLQLAACLCCFLNISLTDFFFLVCLKITSIKHVIYSFICFCLSERCLVFLFLFL